MGYKTAASASACFNAIKKKLLASAGAESDGTPAAVSATPKKGGKGKTKGKGKRAAADEEVLQPKAKKAKAKTPEDGELEAEAAEAGEEGEGGVKSEGGEAE